MEQDNFYSEEISSDQLMDKDLPILTKSKSVEFNMNNGFILNEFYIPTEVLLSILHLVDAQSLRMNCVLVCKSWRDLITEDVWKLKAEEKLKKILKLENSKAYFFICLNENFDNNLIPNPSGENKLEEWVVHSNGGDGWIVEDVPQGCETLPEKEFGQNTKCFATSYQECIKSIEIDLLKHQFTAELMELEPDIYISEWYGTRFDCGCEYRLNVTLSDADKIVLKEFDFRFTEEQFQGGTWNKIEYTFQNYGKNCRYIRFIHSGRDNKFWAGHYGNKLAGATVKLLSSTLGQNKNEASDGKICIWEKRGNGPIETKAKKSESDYYRWLVFAQNEAEESDEEFDDYGSVSEEDAY